MSEYLYVAGDESILEPLDVAIERAEEAGITELIEMRPSTFEDVDADDLTDAVWVWIDEHLQEHERLAHDSGSAELDADMYRRAKGDRPTGWHTLWGAIRRVLIDHGDFSNAAWTDVRTITLDEARTLLATKDRENE